MASAPGWYPDPAGRTGLLRYWDGTTWTTQVRPGAAGPVPQPFPQPSAPPPAGTSPPARRGWGGWIVAALAVVVVLVVVAVLAVPRLTALVGGSSGDPTPEPCPPGSSAGTPPPAPNDGRVHGGALSYPRLGSPWRDPAGEHEIPFGRDVSEQFAVIEEGSFLGFRYWGANVLVGELVAGDGFFAPQDGAPIVVRCVMGTFYGDTEVTRDDRRNEALTVDGRPAWVIETRLGFDVPNLQAKSELLIVVVVDIGDGTAGLFLASLPENGPQYVPDARRALAQLRVDA